MARALIEGILLFLAPFALFALWVSVAKRAGGRDAFARAFVVLTICGLVLAIGGMIWAGLRAQRDIGVYEPAHTENGVLVPGRVR